MSAPVGSSRVEYTVAVHEDPENGLHGELIVQFSGSVAGSSSVDLDAALEAAGNSVHAYVQSLFPGRTVQASRVYTGTLTGIVWP